MMYVFKIIVTHFIDQKDGIDIYVSAKDEDTALKKAKSALPSGKLYVVSQITEASLWMKTFQGSK